MIATISAIPKRPIKWEMEVTREDGSRVTVIVKAYTPMGAERDAMEAVEGGVDAEWVGLGFAPCCVHREED